jgi:hypothetical protein
MDKITLPDAPTWSGVVNLPHLTCLHADGPEAATFLHGQLSQDIENLGDAEARLAAYCSPKGRMLGDALVLRPHPERILLVLGADVAPAVLKRLSMFVLRAKAKLSAATHDLALMGLLGEHAEQALAGAAPQAGAVVPHGGAGANAWVVRLPSVKGLARALWIGPAAQAPTASHGDVVPPQAWRWLEIASGVPRIEQATVDQFVPQMVNYELVGGVNFKKGCYPGQEIVARSQYRGTLKRRLYLLHTTGQAQPGQEIFSADDPGQPAGLVVNAAQVPGSAGASSLLAELKIQHAHSPLTLGAADGPALQLGDLPYEVSTQDA